MLAERLVEEEFDFPPPPQHIPEWAINEAGQWIGLDEFDILVQAESKSGKIVDIEYVPLSVNIWGLHVARGKRAVIYINRSLPLVWKRFALFHELYHLLSHRKGHSFWSRTATPMNSFEHQADMFAWAVIWPEIMKGTLE